VSVETIDAFFKLDRFRGLELHGPRNTTFIGAGTGAFDRWRLDPRRCIVLTRIAIDADGNAYTKIIGSAPKGARNFDTSAFFSYTDCNWNA
jgi:hypothetical protein